MRRVYSTCEDDDGVVFELLGLNRTALGFDYSHVALKLEGDTAIQMQFVKKEAGFGHYQSKTVRYPSFSSSKVEPLSKRPLVCPLRLNRRAWLSSPVSCKEERTNQRTVKEMSTVQIPFLILEVDQVVLLASVDVRGLQIERGRPGSDAGTRFDCELLGFVKSSPRKRRRPCI